MTLAPVFRTMSQSEAEALLARNHVGRLAFTMHDAVDIEPIHYVFSGGIIHGRTAPGTKLTTLAHVPWVALEADEVESLFRWRSVVVRGTVYLPENTTGADQYRDTLAALRQLVPGTLTGDDPTPHRTVLFQIHIREITGRAAEDGAG